MTWLIVGAVALIYLGVWILARAAAIGDNQVDQEHKKDASRPPRAGAA